MFRKNKCPWGGRMLMAIVASVCAANVLMLALPGAAADPAVSPPPAEASSDAPGSFRVTILIAEMSSAPLGSWAQEAASDVSEPTWRVSDALGDVSFPVLTIAIASTFAGPPTKEAAIPPGALAPAQTTTPGWGRRLARWILGLVGATRWISASNALEQRTRHRVYHAVQRHPAIHAGALATMLDLRRQTILYHLHVLTSEGLLISRLSGRRRYYCSGDRSRDNPRLGLGATANRVLEQLAERSHTKDDLAAALGISPRGVAWHLRRLTESGLVRVAASEPTNVYALCGPSRTGASPG